MRGNFNTVHDRDTVFRFIVDYKRENDGISPSIEEIMATCGISSKSACQYILKGLQRDGRIILGAPRATRNIRIPGGRWTIDGRDDIQPSTAAD